MSIITLTKWVNIYTQKTKLKYISWSRNERMDKAM